MYNSFGNIFRFTTWGESHGKAIGCVIDGVPSCINITEDDIQKYLDKRKPATSDFTSQRKEEDIVEILSGVFEGKTTGAPMSLIIYNKDYKSQDYSEIKDIFRPGHADFVYEKKYGHRDYRGGGRSSARETAMRVAAGAVARKILEHKFSDKVPEISGALIQIGPHKINYNNWDWKFINQNPFFSPDREIITIWEKYITQLKEDGDSAAAIIEIHVKNMPIGLGDPIYYKLDAKLASAIMSINAVKSVEIGAGNDFITMQGSQSNDQIYTDNVGNIKFKTNHAGGVLGGISNGQDLIVRFTVKAPSSILKAQNTIDKYGNNVNISVSGRHDPCVGIRAIAVGEAMVACVLADL